MLRPQNIQVINHYSNRLSLLLNSRWMYECFSEILIFFIFFKQWYLPQAFHRHISTLGMKKNTCFFKLPFDSKHDGKYWKVSFQRVSCLEHNFTSKDYERKSPILIVNQQSTQVFYFPRKNNDVFVTYGTYLDFILICT